MKLLAEISDATVGLGKPEQLGERYEFRKNVRAVLRNADGLISVQHIRNNDHHKLPGGGVEIGETLEEALKREIREEVGCDAVIGNNIGVVVEYRNDRRLLHIGYGFEADVVGEIGEPQQEEEEVAEGQENVWMSADEALRHMREDVPNKDKGHFILARERAFLEEYLSRA